MQHPSLSFDLGIIEDNTVCWLVFVAIKGLFQLEFPN